VQWLEIKLIFRAIRMTNQMEVGYTEFMSEKLWYRYKKGKGCLVDTDIDGRIILNKIGCERVNRTDTPRGGPLLTL
jgi:hypothetical protein